MGRNHEEQDITYDNDIDCMVHWGWCNIEGFRSLSLPGQPREDCSSLGGQWWTGGSLQSYSSPLGLPWQLPP